MISNVLHSRFKVGVSPEHIFIISAVIVNGGNYFYNLLLGRTLGPHAFADAALIITSLLFVSFVGMTFQLGAAKFIASTLEAKHYALGKWFLKRSIGIGLVAGLLMIFFSTTLKNFFQTSSSFIFIILGAALPIYFWMSVGRGIHQGRSHFITLSASYQIEMLVRFSATFLFIWFFPEHANLIISMAIFLSIVVALFPLPKWGSKQESNQFLDGMKPKLKKFLIITAIYECSQILCNNGDIFLVKHFFENTEAGLYSSLALIGRVVYFLSWMFVMLLLPKVVAAKRKGESTRKILAQLMTLLGVIFVGLLLVVYAFPGFVVSMLFGNAFLEIAPLLFPYAVATTFFALSNVFTYYFLSLDNFVAVWISLIFGIVQLVAISMQHASLEEVVWVQIGCMLVLLLIQSIHFIKAEGLFSANKV